MANTAIQKPFSHPFLSAFVLAPDALPFRDQEIVSLDRELSEYEQVFLNPDIEKNLISKNELLASFAISKAEDSQLTLKEAHDVYNLVLSDPRYDFIGEKIKTKKRLTQKDHDQLEFFNIAKTFRILNQEPFLVGKLTPEMIKGIHRQLTQGLDLFADYLPHFTVYKSGRWRDNDLIRVGEYIPAPYTQIASEIKELISWLKQQPTITGVAIFHTALYALHPFHNGNKRVSRVLEHVLLRALGVNAKNLYSTSYYYHKEKPRYYKYLFYSLERRNLNHFVSFALEAIVLSIISVVKTSLEMKRNEFLNKYQLEPQVKTVLKPLIKRHQLQFKNLYRYVKGKMARQTFVNYLQATVEQGLVNRREAGRTTYYSLNFTAPEVKTLTKWLDFASKRLPYIPDNIRLV